MIIIGALLLLCQETIRLYAVSVVFSCNGNIISYYLNTVLEAVQLQYIQVSKLFS